MVRTMAICDGMQKEIDLYMKILQTRSQGLMAHLIYLSLGRGPVRSREGTPQQIT